MSNDYAKDDIAKITDEIRSASADAETVVLRSELAHFTADIFNTVGKELQTVGHIFGTDHKNGLSPNGHGSDEIVAVGLLLRIASQLISAANDLFSDGRHYAAASLLRQLVEIEYLAWAFETRDGDAERWLRSNSNERQSFFTPAKLRAAAQGKFRSKDYGYHCELGGHPVPGAIVLLRDDQAITQLLLSDMLGHSGRIWDHLLDWSHGNPWAVPLSKRKVEMYHRFANWKAADALTSVSPPP